MSYSVIGSDGKELKTNVLLHPGEVLAEELSAREIVKSRFAMNIKMYPGHFSDIVNCKKNITEDIALRIEKELGISAEFWMRLQVEYNISLLRAKAVGTS